MAHVKPHWEQPSHPELQEVQHGSEGFTARSISKVALPPFGLFAKLSFPPCDMAKEPTYATVQFGRDKHLNLNSDLLYINHSCEPSLIFDTANFNVIAGPKGLEVGEELTFFYPSTEWHMAQPFDCLCGKPTCRGRISGAKDMPKEKMEGLWINGHIREMLEEQESQTSRNGAAVKTSENDVQTPPALQNGSEDDNTATGTPNSSDPTAMALKDALMHAEKVVASARSALQAYMDQQAHVTTRNGNSPVNMSGNVELAVTEAMDDKLSKVVAGSEERGVTSRELSGEMGGDTTAAIAK